jgi:tRNA-specific 2-thiouridylase
MKNERLAKTVVVGMSGGVDSSVCALLLKQKGYRVIGLFMQNWDDVANNDILGKKDSPLFQDMCDPEIDFKDAYSVAEKIGIEIHRVNFVKEYWEYVFKYFIDEYSKSRTPNPDVMCNKFIKFDLFLKYAIEKFNCDYIAMGHYADVKLNNGIYELHKCVDVNKDQTYFLYQLNQYQLSKVIFPLANLKKIEVRKIAKENGLINHNKRDSTGICFIGERKFQEFLRNYLPSIPGNIVDIETSEVVGKHNGVMYYTIGQNKNLNLGGNKDKYFVCKKDPGKKTLYVCGSSYESKYLMNNVAVLDNINIINNASRDFVNSDILTAKFRHSPIEYSVKVKFIDNNLVVVFKDKIRALSIGQSIVIYDEVNCIGGGIINKVYSQE